MNEELLIPGVPALSDEWIAQRTQHLMEEVAAPSPRRKRHLVLTGAGAGAVFEDADVGEGIAHSPTAIDLDKHTCSMYVLSMMTDHASAGLAVADLPQGRLS